MAVFDGVRYALSHSLSPTRRTELAAVLDLNGAAPNPPYTHLIALAASHAYDNATNDPAVKLVTDRWVDRSIVLGKCQPEQYYSPDPAMIFSGVVACATDLSVADLEVLSAGITALGGQWRIGLTRDVTHLFALRPGSDKYNTALHFAPQTHMNIITPHWFDDAVRLGRRIPETPYAWPDPPALRPGVTLDPGNGVLAADGRRRRKHPAEAGADDSTTQDKHVRVWAGRRILLSTSLELASSSRAAIETGIRRSGGVIVHISEAADEVAEEKAVEECDVFVTRWRSGKTYFKAARASILIGTLSWLFSVESSGTLHSPLDSLLWYPTPRGGIPGLIDCEISVTNYTGAARDYLKRLIVLVGAKFTPSMSQSNKVLIAGFQPSPKTTRALSWSIPVVNHTWLEDCFVEWRSLTVGLERYIVYPPGIDFGKVLMVRHDELPSSQSVSIPRSSGGAVPGGRGVGVVDLEQEEMRDTEFRARNGKGILGQSTARENDTTVDGMSWSMSPLEGDILPESRAHLSLSTESIKKTPTSSARAKRGSISTPFATGLFVDHVVELPADKEDGGKERRTPANRKQRTQPALLGARATPQSLSRASSVDLFSAAKEVEVVVPRLEGSSKAGESKDVSQSGLHSSKSKPRRIQQRPDVQAASKEVVEKQALSRASKPRLRVGKGTVTGSDSDSHQAMSGDEASEVSTPPQVTGAGSTTPVKSGMKPRPKSKSMSRHGSTTGGMSEDEMRMIAVGSGRVEESGKRRDQVAEPIRNGEVATKEKEKEKSSERREETERNTSRPRSRNRSLLPSPTDAKNARTPKRRLSVLVPSVPEEYFSSQSMRDTAEAEKEGDRERESKKRVADAGVTSGPSHKQLSPASSIHVVSAEVSKSTSKRGKPYPAKLSTSRTVSRNSASHVQAKPKTKPGGASVHKAQATDENTSEEEENTSIVVDEPISLVSTKCGGQRRRAADKATTRLREKMMPDVINFEKEQKQAKRRRSEDWRSVTSAGGEKDEITEDRSKKRRKIPSAEEEEGEEAEVTEAVSVPLVKGKSKQMDGKNTAKRKMTVGSDKDTDRNPAVTNKSGGSEQKKDGRGRGKEIRLMTTGVTLSDDVVKRLTKLGLQMTTKPTDCTHLIAKGIVRTEKFLCAMSVSPYVLTEEWANASAKGGKLLSESHYLLSDATAEQKWAFKFADALARAKGPEGGSNLFKQMTFYVTPKVSVDTKLLKNVVAAGGGQVRTSPTPTVRILKGKSIRFVVSCQEDKGIWRPLVQEGFKVYTPELLLRGALRQEIEWEREECLIVG